MTDYKKMYFILFNAITDASRLIEKGEYADAKDILDNAQIKTEDLYIEAE